MNVLELVSNFTAKVIAMPKLRTESYRAAKRAVRERCLALHLNAAQQGEAEDHTARLHRKGRSAAAAVAAGIKLAKALAQQNARGHLGGAA